MASEEFISLGAPDEADVKDDQAGEFQDEAPDANGAEPLASELQPEGGASAASSSPKASDENLDLEEGQVEDMDLADDDVVVTKHQQLDALVQSETSVASVHGFYVETDKGNRADVLLHASTTISVDESRILRNETFISPCTYLLTYSCYCEHSYASEDSSVSIESCEFCSHKMGKALESKRKLMELMQRWSEWQTRTQRNLKDDVEEVLESGEETYYPALQIGSEKSCPVVSRRGGPSSTHATDNEAAAAVGEQRGSVERGAAACRASGVRLAERGAAWCRASSVDRRSGRPRRWASSAVGDGGRGRAACGRRGGGGASHGGRRSIFAETVTRRVVWRLAGHGRRGGEGTSCAGARHCGGSGEAGEGGAVEGDRGVLLAFHKTDRGGGSGEGGDWEAGADEGSDAPACAGRRGREASVCRAQRNEPGCVVGKDTHARFRGGARGRSFWVDIQARESAVVEEDSVPLYDREFTLGSTPLGDSSSIER
ncbi:hypothetical protein PR202_gb17348 [Eleusine coracana subsp. coracana]|uniref:Uncharacterized protein n=1 Tax=Eleusine coracana subsp. coracana TaxID=191504 RepID=A0AAV5F2P8_ELECO|nr:hypothetical protein PR202_gb17348 [Eleusine coracana subsp. coracana]